MAEYIDKDIAVEKMVGLLAEFPDEIGSYLQGRCVGALLFAPAADVVELKHGKWYRHDKKIHGDTCYHCSVCEKMALTDCGMVWELTPYCPFCGAKMDGGNNA